MQTLPLQPGTTITEDTRVPPGKYFLPDPEGEGAVRILADGVLLDLTGVELIGAEPSATPDTYSGLGIVAHGRRKLTIRGGTIRGYKIGIYLQGADGSIVEDCDLSGNYAMRLKSTPEAEDPDDWLWPHHNDQNEWMRYGAGLYLEETRGAIVRRNRGRRSQNGILLDSVTDSQVYDNDFSFLSGWGLALWRSSRNLICRNRFDWCVRGYSHGVYWRGQDSAGILVFEQCCENLFVYNSATHGGDGFFLYAGHETLQETGTGGSNRNLLYRNDFSHAVANGIEATFSGGNRFQENRLEECQHGIWAGYSYETLIVGNEIHRSAGVGIAIEHGHHNQIVGNRFSENPVAIRLWWSPNPQFDEGPYGRHHNTRSEDNLILGNRFLNDRAAVWLRDTHRTQIVRNCWIHCGRHVVQEGDCAGTVLRENLSEAAPGWEPPELEAPVLPELPGEQDPFLPPGAKRGRRYIVIDEWGPVHPDELPD